MRIAAIITVLVPALAPAIAFGDDLPPPPPAGDGSGSGSAAQPTPDAPPPADKPIDLPPPVTVTPPAPPPTTTTPTVTPPPDGPLLAPDGATTPPPTHDEPSRPFNDDYYDRKRGIGMFHSSRMTIGVLQGKAPNFVDGMAPTDPMDEKSVTRGEFALDGVYLGIPSSYGHFHGIEFSTGLRTGPIDFWLHGGTAFSLFNIGRGGPGSLRVGGSVGAGFNLAHGYGYVRGRAAIVLIPAQLDGEVSAFWVPSSASTGNYEELVYRASVWYRPSGSGGSKRAYEVYGEMYHRTDDTAVLEKEFTGIGAGVGMTLF